MCLSPALRDTAAALLEVGEHLKITRPGMRGHAVSSLGTHLVQLRREHLGALAPHSHGCCVVFCLASSLLFLGWETLNISILRTAEKKDTYGLKALGRPVRHLLDGDMSMGSLPDPHHGPNTEATAGGCPRQPVSLQKLSPPCAAHQQLLAVPPPAALCSSALLQAAGILLAAERAEIRSPVRAAQAQPCMENVLSTHWRQRQDSPPGREGRGGLAACPVPSEKAPESPVLKQRWAQAGGMAGAAEASSPTGSPPPRVSSALLRAQSSRSEGAQAPARRWSPAGRWPPRGAVVR